ncbi:MAG: hypothetical protein AAGJ35_03500 [Myxococcota bacterium]
MNKRQKGYWSKKKERFSSGEEAKRRAVALRNNEYTVHVKVIPQEQVYLVIYSIPKWYEAQLEQAGIHL